MTLRKLISPDIKNHIKLLRAKRRFPGRTINSYQIAENVELGQDCFIGQNAQIHAGARLGASALVYEDVVIGNGVHIGDYSYINARSIIVSASIGKFCSIASGCQIGMQNHPVDHLSTSPFTYTSSNIFNLPKLWEDIAAPPQIHHDVWIGAQAIIMQGVTVGSGAIVGAGAVVTRDVAPYAIVAGVPAQFVRPRFDAAIADFLLDLKWWDLPLEDLKKLKDVFAAKEHWQEKIVPQSLKTHLLEANL